MVTPATVYDYHPAADRLETMRPPYAVVKAQMQTPRREIKITVGRLISDERNG